MAASDRPSSLASFLTDSERSVGIASPSTSLMTLMSSHEKKRRAGGESGAAESRITAPCSVSPSSEVQAARLPGDSVLFLAFFFVGVMLIVRSSSMRAPQELSVGLVSSDSLSDEQDRLLWLIVVVFVLVAISGQKGMGSE